MITSNDQNLMVALQERLQVNFSKPELLVQALTHKSYYNENPGTSQGHNEVLEFLGDAVLDLCLGHLLMLRFGSDDEGKLSKKRASLVNEATLSEISQELNLENLILLGRGERTSGGSKKPRLLAAAFEALVGAVYLDLGFQIAQKTINDLFTGRIEKQDWTEDFAHDFKTRLQEKLQYRHGMTPNYYLVGQSGPDHEKQFEVEVKLGEKSIGTGVGPSKKQAEQEAAKQALGSYLGPEDLQEGL
jgi:ribonuclease III